MPATPTSTAQTLNKMSIYVYYLSLDLHFVSTEIDEAVVGNEVNRGAHDVVDTVMYTFMWEARRETYRV